MSDRCRETSGILFSRRCKSAASVVCASCQKPVCDSHARTVENLTRCITCLRALQRERNVSHFRDDPLFYWYDDPQSSTFTDDDYALFDSAVGDRYDSPDEGAWEGS